MSGIRLRPGTYLDICPGLCLPLSVPVHQETGGLGCVYRSFPGDDCDLVAKSLEQFDNLAANKASAASHQDLPGAHLSSEEAI